MKRVGEGRLFLLPGSRTFLVDAHYPYQTAYFCVCIGVSALQGFLKNILASYCKIQKPILHLSSQAYTSTVSH
jgi:hypothetical protein